MFLASSDPPSLLLVGWTLLGGFLAAGGANTINQYMDRDIDVAMERTRKRPLPGGRMRPREVLLFGLILSTLSFVQLWWTVNFLTAALALGGILYYVFIYTQLLKRHSTQNIVVGGAAGAVPPLVGWAAVANEISLLPVFMFLIVFYWTPPHFWAIALLRQKEYSSVRVPMLPVIVGMHETRRQMTLYTILLFLVSIMPVFLRLLGPVYFCSALILNSLFLWQAVDLQRDPTEIKRARFYKFSLLYLALLFSGMGIDGLFFR